ncbi:23S rRNA (adenine(1618)-N(6))-methyltransferase RlmF [Undibacterium sp. Di24W]|uniref:23S rRNA (adenine(1618)-N(6))-methyltransferase RlmF n=1 Tax=Undibacterium sp. Di24W TaxID=3413033 RepID=UPI003BF1ABDD
MSSPRHNPQKKPTQAEFHPRNRHQGQYDFTALIDADRDAGAVALGHFVNTNPYGDLSIDFANPKAVKALNRALLKHQYGINAWGIPDDYLCPPVPGRADYIHCLADLLAASNQGRIPKKSNLQALDIGTGANGIYPLIGASCYHWKFTATDINPESIANLNRILLANPQLTSRIQTRLQTNHDAIFRNIIGEDDWFDFSMCNPPFHSSPDEAREGSKRKWENLGQSQNTGKLNFGGQHAELWCDGGELAFIQKMIQESQLFATRCFWFTSLVSKASNLPAINAALKRAHVQQSKTIDMQQGQKQSRFIAWNFLNPVQQAAWAKMRW